LVIDGVRKYGTLKEIYVFCHMKGQIKLCLFIGSKGLVVLGDGGVWN